MFVVRVGADARVTTEAAAHLNEDVLCRLLDTDVTERLRAFEVPPAFAEARLGLCYFIDGRGGERQLDSNFCGTCLYHTGCPVYGDLIFAAVEQDAPRAMTAAECQLLAAWLCEQFPFLAA